MASSETAAAVQRDSEEHATLRRVAVSSFLGNFIEWFDYASYSYFATVIALVLMPPGDPTVALLETFGVFALSFLMRPVGAFFWGHMGDKKGRKWALATSILMMSAATFVIGLLPTFEAVGILAPIRPPSWPSTPRPTTAACTARSCPPRRLRACSSARRSPRSCS